MLALALLLLPLRWLLAALSAAAFHELCHWAAVRLCGGKVTGLRIGAGGAVMAAEELSGWKELLCTLAGPVGSLLLVLTAKWFPAVAVCAIFQSAYNLLPVYPMDGGRILRCGARILLPPRIAEGVCIWTERLCLGAMGAVALYAWAFLKLGPIPVLLVIAVILKKSLANRAQKEYNSPIINKEVRL